MTLPNCLDCNTNLKDSRSIRCKRCANLGVRNPQYGKARTLKARLLTSKANKGRSPWSRGKHHSEETKKLMSLARKGISHGPMSEETKRKISLNSNVAKGEVHYNWKGGLSRPSTLLNKAQRLRFHKEMKYLILKRDNFSCQMCDTKGKNLHVDHIQPWSEYVELRFSMDNCRTLCANCHYKVTYGREMPRDIMGWGQNKLRKVGK